MKEGFDPFCEHCENVDTRCILCGNCEICDIDLHTEDCPGGPTCFIFMDDEGDE